MYADDMTELVVGTASIKSLMKIMNEFKIYSGLGVNDEKTESKKIEIVQKLEKIKSKLEIIEKEL